MQQELTKKVTDATREIDALQKNALKYDNELKEANKNMDSLVKKVQEQSI
jgi:hypothetical protein